MLFQGDNHITTDLDLFWTLQGVLSSWVASTLCLEEAVLDVRFQKVSEDLF